MNTSRSSNKAVPIGARRSAHSPRAQGTMLRLARWCVAHRRRVVVGWIAVAVVITASRRGGRASLRHQLHSPRN